MLHRWHREPARRRRLASEYTHWSRATSLPRVSGYVDSGGFCGAYPAVIIPWAKDLSPTLRRKLALHGNGRQTRGVD